MQDYDSFGEGPIRRDEMELLPVMVFFHGGAFVVGSCESILYGPQVLLDRDVVMVGVNYRLGVFGFLSLETDDAPGYSFKKYNNKLQVFVKRLLP